MITKRDDVSWSGVLLCEHDPYPGAGYHCLRDAGHLGLCTDHTLTWTSPALIEQDGRDYPHDEPCPNCGRRQWGLDAADPMNPTDAEQETCAGCGYTYADEHDPAGCGCGYHNN